MPGKMNEAAHRARLVQRFNSLVDTEGDCWEWLGRKDKDGYGVLDIRNKVVRAHRFSYEYAYGAIPDGASVIHACSNRSCVKPDHLRVGNQTANMIHCAMEGNTKGMKLTPENVIAIRQMLVEGLPQGEIAAKFNVTQGTISQISLGKTYRWLD